MTAVLSAEMQEQWERIARMLSLGVSETQVAEAVGLSVGRISQLKDDERFQQVLMKAVEEQVVQQMEIDQGWDHVERKALKVVNANLDWNKNPDFALRAALTANRATRRGNGLPNRTIDATNLPGRAVLTLSHRFVERLTAGTRTQEVTKVATLTVDADAKKVVNMLPAPAVKALMQPAPVMDKMPDLDFMKVENG